MPTMVDVSSDAQTTEAIMRRVRLMFFLSSFWKSVLAETCVCAGVLAVSSLFVSYRHIITNARGTLASGSFFQYMLSAVWHTEWILKGVLAIGFAASVFFMWSAARKIPFARRYLVNA